MIQNKTHLIAVLAEKTGIPKTTVKPVLDAFFDEVAGLLGTGESLPIVGFGKFEDVTRPARELRVPGSEDRYVNVPESHIVKFRPGSKLKSKTE